MRSWSVAQGSPGRRVAVGHLADNAVDVAQLIFVQGGVGVDFHPGVDTGEKGRILTVNL
ncbi:MAG: hypothetical protein PHI97_27295 [Desulfobulbus sp.]|nr:hypothetical protein [Desulfobulbus sp.]